MSNNVTSSVEKFNRRGGCSNVSRCANGRCYLLPASKKTDTKSRACPRFTCGKNSTATLIKHAE
ncbi:hypothetical protein [Candidatus Ichthyocystis sparus]|uniref:hypothetical protein n=1 Tax=Candidatus Ichthyocystis sparus TaxID=1561004 RepID=UPI0011464390|nr:hypothetical protein [Candidatus Ichthyocystis sparus]